MDINEISDALDGLHVDCSEYEFQNFFLETYPTSARQLIAVMQEIERLHAHQLTLKYDLECTSLPGKKMLLQRELRNIKKRYEQLIFWYDQIDPDMRRAILNSFDSQEPEYWANHLGRQAALELLTMGRSSKKTMDMMSNLPIDAFEEAVRICLRYANLIKDTTSGVEQAMGVSITGMPTN